ncbi:FAD-binding oxidoreductase [Nisaea sp.]|uniref:NAD(P)/FAD-dependent oxidoreductase n=1 Tax=Nisaea sp. TaxID=2024842 RepID=UPI002B264CDB|nr:FAD-binding oxidoreductase [Nisaea sp.]
MSASPKIVIAGAGIIGAVAAFELSRAGADVTIIEARPRPGEGVSAASFGWINAITFDPENDPSIYALRQQAIGSWAALEQALGKPLPAHRQGALFWGDTRAETMVARDRHREAGCDYRIVDRVEIAELLPQLTLPPEAALFAPEEFALDVTATARMLLKAAEENGAALITGTEITAIESAGGRVRAVRAGDTLLEADRLIVAAGTGSGRILAPFVQDLGVEPSPAALVTVTGNFPQTTCITDSPELEFRIPKPGLLISAHDVPEGSDPEGTLARRTIERTRRILKNTGELAVRSVQIGQRPFPIGGTPLVGPVASLTGAYVAVAHPGVILAPAIGARVCDLVSGRAAGSGLQPIML